MSQNIQPLTMPQWGLTMTEGTLVKWVSEGRVTIPLLGPLFLDKIVEKRGGKLFCDALGSVEFFLSAND